MSRKWITINRLSLWIVEVPYRREWLHKNNSKLKIIIFCFLYRTVHSFEKIQLKKLNMKIPSFKNILQIHVMMVCWTICRKFRRLLPVAQSGLLVPVTINYFIVGKTKVFLQWKLEKFLIMINMYCIDKYRWYCTV